jgi:hypothetical protein
MQATGFVRRSSMSVGRWPGRASALNDCTRSHQANARRLHTFDAPDGSCRPTEPCMRHARLTPPYVRQYVRLCVVAVPPGQAVAVARGNWDAWPGLICQSPDP